METDVIQEVIGNRLTNISDNEEATLLRGEYRYNDVLVAIYYINYGEDNLSFDIDEYQERHISSDYYDHPGIVQWNYYLIFVRAAGIVSKELQGAIENNDLYTRKLILTREELKNYFSYHSTAKAVETDVVASWKEKLRAVDLDEVYDITPYTQAVARFISNDVKKENITEQVLTPSVDAPPIIKKISQLKINDGYREYPKIKEFTFGKVNLIHGVNGSGKTSFLEAIELIIAGKSAKDPAAEDLNNCVNASYNGDLDDIDSYTPNDNAKYRMRDIAWYSSAYKTGNELHRTFNRYNFYDSDAAYKLSYGSDLGNISNYLSAIALGAEFNRIQDRLNGFQDRLEKELRDRKKILSDEAKRISDAKVTISSYHGGSDPEFIFELFDNTSKEVRWVREIPQQLSSDDSNYEQDYQSAKSIISSINQQALQLKVRTSKSVARESEMLNAVIRDCQKIEKLLLEVREGIKIKVEESKVSELHVSILQQAERYFENSQSFLVASIDEEISLLDEKLSKYKRVIARVSNVVNPTIFATDQIFKEFKLEHQDKLAKLKETKDKLQKQIDGLRNSLDKLQSLVSELKTIGKTYITLNKEADACPLCDMAYDHQDLERRILALNNSISENAAISIFSDELVTVNQAIEEVESLNNDINSFEQAIAILHPTAYYSESLVKAIAAEIDIVRTALDTENAEKTRLGILRENLNGQGFSKVNYELVKNQIEASFKEIAFSESSLVQFKELYAGKKKAMGELAPELSRLQNVEKNLNQQLKQALSSLVPEENIFEYKSLLVYRQDMIEKAVAYIVELKSYLHFDEDEDFSDVEQKIEKLHSSYEIYKKAITEQSQLILAKGIIEAGQQVIDTERPIAEKIETGVDVISEILEKDKETIILGDFLRENESEIQSIFQNLHSPKEFTGIFFDYTNGSVSLKRQTTDVNVPLVKISTGQRSALALSIFLALNRKLHNGPNIILFDDPVTYTDDLNILSFLDNIRELVVNEDRQLFFATANQKLAGLFQKKFKFLGEDFKDFKFERFVGTQSAIAGSGISA